MNAVPRLRRILEGAFLAVTCCLAVPGSLRADNLDKALLNEAPFIVDELLDQKCTNVGVLHFRVEKPGLRMVNFGAGAINANLATRLENALIAQLDERARLGIIRDATATASRHKVGSWYSKEAERKKLFAFSDYPLAWGTSKVKPDAFLTGSVVGPDDKGETKVIIECFTAKASTISKKVGECIVRTDRALLSDMGKSFTLNKRSIQGKSTREIDRLAALQVRKRDVGGTAEVVSLDNIAGLSFKLLYDEQEQEIQRISGDNWQAPSPRTGQKIKLVLQHANANAGILGVVVKVNDISIFKQQRGESLRLQKWVFEPGTPPEPFLGFYMDNEGKDLRPFNIIAEAEAEAKAAEIGTRAGLIDVEVFGNNEGPKEEMEVSLRSLTRRGAPAPAPKTAAEAQARLRSAGGMMKKSTSAGVRKRGDDGLIVPDAAAIASETIGVKNLEKPTLLGRVTIKYNDPKSTEMELVK